MVEGFEECVEVDGFGVEVFVVVFFDVYVV